MAHGPGRSRTSGRLACRHPGVLRCDAGPGHNGRPMGGRRARGWRRDRGCASLLDAGEDGPEQLRPRHAAGACREPGPGCPYEKGIAGIYTKTKMALAVRPHQIGASGLFTGRVVLTRGKEAGHRQGARSRSGAGARISFPREDRTAASAGGGQDGDGRDVGPNQKSSGVAVGVGLGDLGSRLAAGWATEFAGDGFLDHQRLPPRAREEILWENMRPV